MSIVSVELKEYISENVSDSTPSQNGGLMSALEIISAIKNNIFPDVSQDERSAGATQYRKAFHKVVNDDDETLSNSRIHMIQRASGDDYVTIFEGTQSDTEADISSPDEYGVGVLSTEESAGSSEIEVTVESPDPIIFRTGDTIWISDGVNTEYHSNITVDSKVGNVYTITLSDTLTNAFATATPTLVASVIEVGSLVSNYDAWNETVGGGADFDETTYPPLLDNIGTIEQTWTITVLAGASTFSCSGNTVGALENGTIGVDYFPSNFDFTKPYFTLSGSGWGASWQEGDIITFNSHPAAHPVWRKRVVPAGAAAVQSDSYKIRFIGETS